ncbi:phosphate transport system permease protein [Actinacidiphila yanglinensis]|uniref:Phosphate transport system permease protein PstA n=1 Tax=Actinacidiphila yanglinensis TaxID=310779 RepID=A0A1H5W560_9ACTN|nr:phosphate ABC transporter permease PstA [Actinacidiphila yanglinensis]SEF94625.1 phosphate transport system permease protein [Actinacidiphila yanglinensis]
MTTDVTSAAGAAGPGPHAAQPPRPGGAETPRDPAPPPPATTLPRTAGTTGTAPERRRSTGTTRQSDVLALVGAAAAALSTTWLFFTRLAPFSGGLGFVVCAYLLFLAFYALLVSFDEDGPAVRDRIASAIVHSLALLLLVALTFVLVYTLWSGRKALPHLNFLTQDMRKAGPLDPLTVGGIRHAIIGTLIQITIGLVLTVPAGLLCAVFLNEVPGRYARFVRTVVEAMTALPSIVAGLFVYATAILAVGLDKSGLAASLAISVMMLPIIIRASDVVIRLVPGTLREASYALGSPRWRTVWHVVLPTARSGLTTAVILGTARGVGETSPVLLTAGFTAVTNYQPLHNPMVSLPLAAFEFVQSPQPAMIARGFGTASVLVVLVLALFVVARVIGGRGPGELTRSGTHRAVLASRRDQQRFARRAAASTAATATGSTASAAADTVTTSSAAADTVTTGGIAADGPGRTDTAEQDHAHPDQGPAQGVDGS